MPWSGWPTTLVSQLTFTEWELTLRPGREAIVGYSLSDLGVWHVLGGDRWVGIDGVTKGSWGAVEIVRQWSEVENLAAAGHRHWRFVHWRNPSGDSVYIAPRLLLAPPLDGRALDQARTASRTRRLWTIVDAASTVVHGFGFLTPAPGGGDDGGDAGGGAGGRGDAHGIVTATSLRPLDGQRLHAFDLTGDDQFLPLEALESRLDRLRERGGSAPGTSRS